MAPLPQPSTTPSPPSSSEEESHPPSVLPGLKRGIAVGAAASICLILIALLTAFVLRRRKHRKAQHQGLYPVAKKLPVAPTRRADKGIPVSTKKIWIPVRIPAQPIEADGTRPIYELDAHPAVQELHAESTNTILTDPHPNCQSPARGENAERRPEEEREAEKEKEKRDAIRFSDVPKLRIQPPQMARWGYRVSSPLVVSPLEEVYSPRSPLVWV